MREIKFRAWYSDRNEMYYSDNEMNLNKFFYYTDGNEDVSLMQFTGHRDQKGKEIYDGDIVHVVNVLTTAFGTEPYDAVIEWDKYRWCMRNSNPNALAWGQFPLNDLDPFGLDITVIGNVYENPELLDGETHVV